MNIHRLLLAAVLLCGIATGAKATRNPVPPPSGIVVHLFGPNSVLGEIAPDLPGETAQPAPAQPGPVPPAGAPANGVSPPGAPPATPQAGGQAAASAPQSANATDPSIHDILHQMFVTGDPTDPNKLAPGRTADRPPARK